MAWHRKTFSGIIGGLFGAQDRHTRDEQFRDTALPHLPAVTRYALSLTRDESDAEDLVQETFLRAFRSWSQFTPGTECRAWLFTICRNVHLRSVRRDARVVTTDDADLEARQAAAVHATAHERGLDDLFAGETIVAAVRDAVDALPEPFRDVVILVDLEEQSYADAARILDVPHGTVRSRLFRGRRLLQEHLIAHARDAGLAQPPGPASGPGHPDEE